MNINTKNQGQQYFQATKSGVGEAYSEGTLKIERTT